MSLSKHLRTTTSALFCFVMMFLPHSIVSSPPSRFKWMAVVKGEGNSSSCWWRCWAVFLVTTATTLLSCSLEGWPYLTQSLWGGSKLGHLHGVLKSLTQALQRCQVQQLLSQCLLTCLPGPSLRILSHEWESAPSSVGTDFTKSQPPWLLKVWWVGHCFWACELGQPSPLSLCFSSI